MRLPSLLAHYLKIYMKKKLVVLGLAGIVFVASAAPLQGGNVPPPSVILGRKEVPILCYHQVRDWKPTDSKVSKDYIMPPADLKAELKMLHDSGYHTILPDQLYAYLTKGTALPSRPVMLTFDDFVIGMEQFGTRIMPLLRCRDTLKQAA